MLRPFRCKRSGALPAISKLGPVHTPGHPLIECGCLDIENSSLLDWAFSEFGLKNEKSLVLVKKIQKKFCGHVLNSLLVDRLAAGICWIPQAPLPTSKRHAKCQ